MYLSSDIQFDRKPGVGALVWTKLIRKIHAGIRRGHLSVVLPSSQRIELVGREPGPNAVIELRRATALGRVLTGGSIGLADGYIEGDWTSPDLVALLEFAVVNAPNLGSLRRGSWPVRLWRRLAHARRRNSKAGSRRNIAFHYDLGNDFYRLWLDDSMAYSSAIAIKSDESLEEAQHARFEQIAELLRLEGHHDLLEIGCGWGSLATAMAPRCQTLTALTLSREQLAWARGRILEEGLGDRVDLRFQDYREVDGQFDRIVSIEMIEAVGEKYWPTYFRKLKQCLKPGGRVVLQAITIDTERYHSYRRCPDFIQHYIFPGGMLPTPGIIAEQAERAGLRVVEVQTFAQGYAATLAEWRRRFRAAWPQVARLGFDERFRRIWDYYLCYCEVGFRIGTIDVGLYVLEPSG
jgi:cyclopropane-fatty-acyl-phospholipid synthase